mgnify:CR=1 FL=1|jgi:hypothetical protein
MNPETGLPYVTARRFSLTMEDLKTWNNCYRILYHTTKRGRKGQVSLRTLVFKLMRRYEHENYDTVLELWRQEQINGVNKKLPKLTLR